MRVVGWKKFRSDERNNKGPMQGRIPGIGPSLFLSSFYFLLSTCYFLILRIKTIFVPLYVFSSFGVDDDFVSSFYEQRHI